jgi:hypothetical protein
MRAVYDGALAEEEYFTEQTRRVGLHMYHHCTGSSAARREGETDEQWVARIEDVDVPADILLSLATQAQFPFIQNAKALAVMLQMLPWVARAQPEQLFLPARVLARFEQTPWSPEQSVNVLKLHQDYYGAPRPERAAVVPGRNDPCHCGSGQKYKRCCLGKGR